MATRGRRRILLLTPAFPPDAGGIERTAAELAGGLDGDAVTVVTSRPTTKIGMAPPPGADVHWAHNDPPYGRRATFELIRLATRLGVRLRPDLVLVLHIRLMPAARALHHLVGSRSLLVLHAKEMSDQPDLARAAIRWADGAVCISKFSRGLALDAGADPARLQMIHPGVTIPRARPPRVGERPGPPTVVTVARVDDWHKGHETALDALGRLCTRLPDVRWVMVGEGARLADLKRSTADRGLDHRVQWSGTVDDAELHRVLQSAHAFCLLSREPLRGGAGEGFGIAFIEAGAHGLPVVAGRTAGVADAVGDDRNGILVDPGDAQQAADALERILTGSAFAQRLADAGRERAEELGWANVVARYDRIIGDVLTGEARGRPCHGVRWLRDLLRGPRMP
jgi:phosphatidyl-myo-inositol dimannoside synthase